MNSSIRILLALPIFVATLLCPSYQVRAYPDSEVLGTSSANPPFDFSVTSSLTGFLLTSDRRLVMSYSESLKLVDLGTFALESLQPPALSSSDEPPTDGVIGGIAYDSGRNDILASQEDGDLLVFDLDDISDAPTTISVKDGDKLGSIAIDANGSYAYVADNTAGAIQVVDLSTQALSTTITLTIPSVSSFTITDALFVTQTNEIYFTTSVGRVFYLSAGETQATRIDIDTTGKKNLSSLAAFSAGDYLYIVDSTTPSVIKLSTATHQSSATIDISENPSPTDIVITSVTNPTATYAYVGGVGAGTGGVSVIDTSNDQVFDLGSDPDDNYEPLPVSAKPSLLAASSSTDGFVYMGFTTGKLGIITANPFVTISGVTFSDGGSTLTSGQSMTMTFRSNQSGTYTIRSGGCVSGTGTLLVDSAGATSGQVTADTDTQVTINQQDNSSAFVEGSNYIWVFVAAESNTGRRATTVTVDTPPPNVSIREIGFGNGRLYITFGRLDVADMSKYRVYVDTDATAVLTKSDPSYEMGQASSGGTQTAKVDDLVNGTTYYIAMDAVDAGGNVSLLRTNTLYDGSVAMGMPEETVGPAGLVGEGGCALVPPTSGRRDVGTSGRYVPASLHLYVLTSILFSLAIIVLAVFRFPYVGTSGRRDVTSHVLATLPSTQRPSQLLARRVSERYLGWVPVWLLSARRVSGRPYVLTFLLCVVFFVISINPAPVLAAEEGVTEVTVPAISVESRESPQMWSIEVKGGFWLPSDAVLDSFFTKCCNMITKIEGGVLFKKRYGIDAGVGFLYKSAAARGVGSGTQSEDRFSFILIPIETSFTWRADYFSWRYLVPYLKTGLDYVFFREGDRGRTTKGMKFGVHGGGGAGINIGEIGNVRATLDSDLGINDMFFTLEARYQWINNFGGGGLDLSGGVYSAGLLFEF